MAAESNCGDLHIVDTGRSRRRPCTGGPLGRAALAAAAVLCLALAARADEVTLETGETLRGTVVERTAGEVVLDHPILGKLRIPGGKVTGVLIGESRKVAPGEDAVAAMPAPAEPVPAWKSKLEVGLNGAGGNTRSNNLMAGVTSERTLPKDIWKFNARYTASSSEGTTTQNRFSAGLRKDWILEDERKSVFAEGLYDHDQFQEWTQRGSVAAGYAFRFLNEKDFTLGYRLGAAGTKEWGSGEDHVRPEGLLGLEGKWKIDASKELVFQSTYYPDLTDRPEYRALSSATISFRLNDAGTLNLRLGVEHEYDTHRTEPFKRTDYRYFLLLVMDF